MDLHRLQDKFAPEDIEWRIGRAGYTQNNKLYATCLAYVTNRAIQNRLDEVCGPENWKNEYREWSIGDKHGVLCGISIRTDGEWVTKWDGADNTDIEAIKGGLSGSMKRAAVQWGIGRYIYDLEERFAVISDNGKHFASGKDKATGKTYRFKWNPPTLPEWALPAEKPTQSAGQKTVARKTAEPAQPRMPRQEGDVMLSKEQHAEINALWTSIMDLEGIPADQRAAPLQQGLMQHYGVKNVPSLRSKQAADMIARLKERKQSIERNLAETEMAEAERAGMKAA